MSAQVNAARDVPRCWRRRGETSRKAILRAASELLLDRGLSSVSMERSGIARGREQGHHISPVAADTDIEAAVDLLYGPFYHRILQGHAPLTDDYTRTIVDYVAAGVSQSTRPA